MNWQMNDGGYIALKRAAEDREGYKDTEKKPAVHC